MVAERYNERELNYRYTRPDVEIPTHPSQTSIPARFPGLYYINP